eukprot:CAMPEP_0174703694 /NCGR_PEP_ID=MMETSP1094-20130205/7549_1 /TAXON_ID=156173 /ORGANISM="Chrysochromulina brevifilum, Strain UTEX LB 985" /LENGTH=112 /DNA_ID=CAMNT_0015901651 /DNA_START=107 /DNA_END=445 /DNA_ORIENTATION=-
MSNMLQMACGRWYYGTCYIEAQRNAMETVSQGEGSSCNKVKGQRYCAHVSVMRTQATHDAVREDVSCKAFAFGGIGIARLPFLWVWQLCCMRAPGPRDHARRPVATWPACKP